MKTLLGCCLGVILLVLLLVGIAVYTVKSNRMDPPNFEEVSEIRHFDSHELQGVILSELPPDVIPVKVFIDTNISNVTVLSDAGSGSISVTGECDTKNGVFQFVSRDGQNGSGRGYAITYLTRKKLFLNVGNKRATKIMDRNQLTIHLPTDSAIDLEINHRAGNLDLELTGIPLHLLKVESKMSEVTIRNLSKNPLVLDDLMLDLSMGKLHLKNMQNFRFTRLSLEGAMGDFHLKCNGPFYRSGTVLLDASIGDFELRFPENVNLINHIDSDSGTLRFNPSFGENRKIDITLEGEVKWGDVRISQ